VATNGPNNSRHSSSDGDPIERRKIATFTIDRIGDGSLSEADRQGMFALLTRYYDAVGFDQFLEDFSEKQYVIRLFDKAGVLVGFSTIQLIEAEVRGITLFSGDTVIDKACWGQKTLQKAFVSFIIRLKLVKPWRKVYWFLITKGYKTYLLIRKNFQCYPNYQQTTPIHKEQVLQNVAKIKYPDNYDHERGVISFQECQGKVKGEYEDIGEEEMKNPDIAFFLKKNPHYKEGDELCCLTEIRLRDLIYVFFKYFLWKPLQMLFRRS
jgi:hypothetical protein